jgi:hypothetical protein
VCGELLMLAESAIRYAQESVISTAPRAAHSAHFPLTLWYDGLRHQLLKETKELTPATTTAKIEMILSSGDVPGSGMEWKLLPVSTAHGGLTSSPCAS